jgi:hypothetical protein
MRRMQEQQVINPKLLIAVAAVAVAALAFVVVSLFTGGGGGKAAPSTVQNVPVQPIANLDIPATPPPPAGGGRDPFQPVVAPATPAPVATAAPEFTPAPRAQALAKPAYVEVLTIAKNQTAKILDGTVVYNAAYNGQTLDRGIVVDKIDSCVHMHRGATSFTVCPGQRALV